MLVALEELKAKKINTITGRGGIVTFRRNLRASVRGLWTGALTRAQALKTFRAAIERGIEAAWVQGAQECDIQKDELTVEELTIRDEFIFEQNEFATNFIDVIVANSKAKGGLLQPLLQRGELWVNRYNDATNQSKSLACKNLKGQWFLGRTEKHCRSCKGFNGRVYRFSTWKKNGALPQSQSLSCNGFNCECKIRPTDKPITKGKFPSRLLGSGKKGFMNNFVEDVRDNHYYGVPDEIAEKYIKTLQDHIKYVVAAGHKLGVDKDLLFIHDNSKWSEFEFPGYAWHFQGGGAPDKFAGAWLHHIHYNPHHWQHWMFPDGFTPKDSEIENGIIAMPHCYALEMVADWMGASMAYTGSWDMTDWLIENFPKVRVHPKTDIALRNILYNLGYANIIQEK